MGHVVSEHGAIDEDAVGCPLHESPDEGVEAGVVDKG